jgi:hypothetical protein
LIENSFIPITPKVCKKFIVDDNHMTWAGMRHQSVMLQAALHNPDPFDAARCPPVLSKCKVTEMAAVSAALAAVITLASDATRFPM